MELTQSFIVLADISGYTKFVKMHKVSMLHAESIITDLLESVIDSTKSPLVLNEVEGDAAFLSAVSDGSTQMARAILEQVLAMFDNFNRKEGEVVSCSTCICSACNKASQLKLKVILHHGEVTQRKVKNFVKPAGEQVILAHRLLKNSLSSNEYILMSEDFHRLSGGVEGMKSESGVEDCEGIGKVNTMVYYPNPSTDFSHIHASLWDKIKAFARLDAHLFQRLLGLKRAAHFNNLAGL